MTTRPEGELAQFAAGVLEDVLDVLGMAVERLARRRRLGAVAQPVQESDAQARLQIGDPLADRGGGNVVDRAAAAMFPWSTVAMKSRRETRSYWFITSILQGC